MTQKNKSILLNQTLMPDPENGDWLLPDFLNYDIVSDEDFLTKVKDLDKEKSQLALGLCIKEILRTRASFSRIADLVDSL